MTVRAHIKDRVLAGREEVFDAIVDPQRLAGFFVSGASGPLREGDTVTWHFDDVGRTFEIGVCEVHRPDRIAFDWSASGETARVTIELTSEGANRALIEITEDGWPMEEEGVGRALGQTQGWTDFVCSMKAYLGYGVNLREGRTAAIHS